MSLISGVYLSVHVEITQEWFCPELGRLYRPGRFTSLPKDVYRRWRNLDYFRRPMAPCRLPDGRVFWATLNVCGNILFRSHLTRGCAEPTAAPKTYDVGEPPPLELPPPSAVKPCGCMERRAARAAAMQPAAGN